MLSLVLASLLSPAIAAEVGGITLPDTVTVAGSELKLNGAGLREFMWIDIYVGGLYMPDKTTDAKKAIEADVPKRVVMEFIFRKVGRDRVLDTFRDGLAKQTGIGDVSANVAKLESWIDRDIVAGDTVVLDYVPGKGITVMMNGKAKGTLEGVPFMRGIFSVFLGEHPASDKLKKAMLGG